MEGNRTCCSGAACIVVLLLGIIAVAWWVYTEHPLVIVHREESTQQTLEDLKRDQQRDRGMPRHYMPPSPP